MSDAGKKKMTPTEKWLYSFMAVSYFQLYWSILVLIITMGSPAIWLNLRIGAPVPPAAAGALELDDDPNSNVLYRLPESLRGFTYFKTFSGFGVANPFVVLDPQPGAGGTFTWNRKNVDLDVENELFNPMLMWRTQIVNFIMNIYLLVVICKLKHNSELHVFLFNLIIVIMMILGNIRVIGLGLFSDKILGGDNPMEKINYLKGYFALYTCVLFGLIVLNEWIWEYNDYTH